MYDPTDSRDEAYKAGREGRSIYTAHSDEFDRGAADRRKAKKKREEQDGTGGGGGGGAVALMLLAVVGVLILLAVTSATAAVCSATILLLATRLLPGRHRVSWAEAYKASFFTVFTWQAVMLLIGGGAVAAKNGAPGSFHQLVREVAHAGEYIGYRVGQSIYAALPLPAGVPAIEVTVFPTAAALALLLVPAVLAAGLALRITLEDAFDGAVGYLIACVLVPLIVVPGVLFAQGMTLGAIWLALHADIAPLGAGMQLVLAASCGVAVLLSLTFVGGVIGAAIVWLLANLTARRAALTPGSAYSAAALALFVTGLPTLLLLYLFRSGDSLVSAVLAAATSPTPFASVAALLGEWTLIKGFLLVALPGLLLGTLVVNRGLEHAVPGASRPLVAGAAVAAMCALLGLPSLALGVLAFRSPWVRSLVS